MDQQTVSILAAVVGSGGLSGALTQYFGLRKEKLAQKAERLAHQKWKSDMETRMSKMEDESPTSLLKRLEEVEDVRESDKREIHRVVAGLRTALRTSLESLSRIEERLKMPSV